MSLTQQPCWRFTPLRPGDRARESQVEKFFTSDVANRVTAVVREGIQNSLDAAVEKVINVRICIGQTSASSVAPYAGGLFGHLNTNRVRQKLHDIPACDEAVTFLTFEDFNTSGLRGDPEQWAPDPDSHNPFFNFFRGEGVTDKSDGHEFVVAVKSAAFNQEFCDTVHLHRETLPGVSIVGRHQRERRVTVT